MTNGRAWAFLLWVLGISLVVVAVQPFVRQVLVTGCHKVGWTVAANYFDAA